MIDLRPYVATLFSLCLMFCQTGSALAGVGSTETLQIDKGQTSLEHADIVVDRDPDTAILITDALLESKSIWSFETLGHIQSVRARAYSHQNLYEKSITTAQQGLNLVPQDSLKLRADLLNIMAASAARLNDSRRAFDWEQKALAIRERLGDSKDLAASHAVIAEIYFDIGLHDKAQKHFNLALEQARLSGNTYSIIRLLNNYAFASLFDDQADRSLMLLREAKTLAASIDNPRMLAYVNQNIGHALVRLNRHDEAEPYVLASLTFAKTQGAPELLTGIHLMLSRIKFDQNEFIAARGYALTAMSYAQSVNYVERISDINKLLSQIEFALGNPKSAYVYLENHVERFDKLSEAALVRSAALFEDQEELLQKRRELERSNQEAEISRLALAKARTDRNSAIFVIGLLSIILVCILIYIREKLRGKKALERKNEELSAAYVEAECANKAKSSFLGIMSHELRTPLNAVIGFSDIIEAEKLGPVGKPDYKVFAHHINNQGHRLLQMIDDILLMTDTDAGKTFLQDNVMTVGALYSAALASSPTFRQTGQDRDVVLENNADKSTILGDQKHLPRALGHLIDNALKFTEGLVRIHVEETQCGSIALTVSDEGPGFDQEEVSEFMAPFAQADASRSRRHEGAGLGLNVANTILALHACDLSIVTNEITGTTAQILIPSKRINVSEAGSHSSCGPPAFKQSA